MNQSAPCFNHNGAVFEEAPCPQLMDLNDAKLALVSLHVFTFYGGAHKSMHDSWHNLNENSFNGIVQTLYQVTEYGGKMSFCAVSLLALLSPLCKTNT